MTGGQSGSRPERQDASSFRLWLRDATRGGHVALDGMMSALDLSSANGYATFLQIHIEAMQRLRLSYRADDQQEFENLIRLARRDLSDFGDSRVCAAQPSKGVGNDAHALGVGYVLRGSRLGAQVLRRSVAPAFPASFLDYATALPWPRFVAQLDDFGAIAAAASRNAVLAGAKLALAVYAQVSSISVPGPDL